MAERTLFSGATFVNRMALLSMGSQARIIEVVATLSSGDLPDPDILPATLISAVLAGLALYH